MTGISQHSRCFFFATCVGLIFLSSCTKNTDSYSSQSSANRSTEENRPRPPIPPSILIWKTLTSLKPKSDRIPDDVGNLLGSNITVVGFVIPNDTSSAQEMQEFLITPMAGGCIHVPPPPPNYIIHVKMAGGKKTKMRFGPVAVEVTGRLGLPKDGDGKYYSYELSAKSVEDFSVDGFVRY